MLPRSKFFRYAVAGLTAICFFASAIPAGAQVITHVTRYTFEGDSADGGFGRSVSGAGDVNNDGFPDLIVGALLENTNNLIDNGIARVFSGQVGNTLYTFEGDGSFDRFGESVSAAGDVNKDGFADLIVGARLDDNNGGESGSARVLSGQDGSTLRTFDGDGTVDFFGISVSGAGDVNNDGYTDVVVGAPFDDNNGPNSGSARVLSGDDGSTLYTFDGDSQGAVFGVSVSGAGDVNNDGYPDLIVGAPEDNGGSARVLSGDGGSTLYTFAGDSAGDRFGFSVSGAGDVNNDGYADLIVGAFFDDNNGFGSGSARVLSGQDGSTLRTFGGDGAGDQFGFSVGGAGDVNDDGFADLIVGAPEDDNNGQDSGSARVFSGRDGSILYTFNGDSPCDQFGVSVSGAGDLNGDGIDDFIVGTGGNYARVFVSQISFPSCGGPIPLLGDVNCDGVVNFLDIPAFIDVLISGVYQDAADTDSSGVVDFADIPSFIDILIGQ